MQEARDLMTTKVRLFGESQNSADEDGSGDKDAEESEEGSLELAEGEDPAQFVDYLRSQLIAFRKAYQCQVLSSMRIIKKLRTVHMDNKRLQAILSMEREQTRLAKLAQHKAIMESATQTTPDYSLLLEGISKLPP